MPITLIHNPPTGDLFPAIPAAPAPAKVSKSPRPSRKTTQMGWSVTDHLCLTCLGRILKRTVDGVVTLRCSNCPAVGLGTHTSMCWCGHKQRAAGAAQRFRCKPNENPTPEFPSEIEVVELK